MHAISSYRGNRPTQTGPITIHCSLARSVKTLEVNVTVIMGDNGKGNAVGGVCVCVCVREREREREI